MCFRDLVRTIFPQYDTPDNFAKEIPVADKKDPCSVRLEAAELIPKVIAEQPERLAKFVKEHDDDVALFQFSCKRHGDFLAVFMTRGPEVDPDSTNYYDCQSNKLVAAIKLGSGAIKFQEGTAPACDITISLGVSPTYPDKPDGGQHYNNPTYKVYPVYQYDYQSFLMMRQDVNPASAPPGGVFQSGAFQSGAFQSNGFSREDEYKKQLQSLVIPGIARAAKDDKITFVSGNVTLFAPAGKGKAVYNSILAAVGRIK